MTLEITIPSGLSKFVDVVKAEGRRNLFSAAANAVRILVRDHLSAQSARRHFTAANLGAMPTGILEKAAAKTTFHADQDHGEVVIPTPAVARALGDVTIAAQRWDYLTIPNNRFSYGKKTKELRSMGWSIFRPAAKGAHMTSAKGQHPRQFSEYQDVLMGTNGQEPVKSLYILKKRVTQRQDRSLLPSDADIGTAAARAMITEIRRVTEKAA